MNERTTFGTMRLALGSIAVLAISAFAQHAMAIEELGTMMMQPFELKQVRLLDGRWNDEQQRDLEYMLSLDSDRLLYMFRKQAGLDTPGKPYGGWESPDFIVKGHFVGMYLSACAMMYASTGNETIKAKADAMVAELAKCQQAMGGDYLSAFPESDLGRVGISRDGEQFDVVAAQKGGPPPNIWPVYYGIHKVMTGMYDMYTLCGNQQAFDILKHMAIFLKRRIDALPNDALDRTLRVEFGGMSEMLHDLYCLTGDPQHLELAHKFDQPEFLGPLALGYDNLTRIHGNTNIPKAVSAARRYEVTGDDRYRDIAMFFWDRVVNTRTYVTGGSTMFERWPEPNRLEDAMGSVNNETCKTYNMLRLTKRLLSETADPKYGDFYERALLNGILGTQGPKPGQFAYYTAMATGYPRVFGTHDNSFWCCYGSGVQNFARVGESIYFQAPGKLFVNLFIPSTADWREEGVRLEQKTQFPKEDSIELRLNMDATKTFALNIRVPYWATQGVEAKVNGKSVTTKDVKPCSWLSLKRRWHDGDEVELRMPMSLHTMPLPDGPQMTAVLYGPVVLAGVIEDATDTSIDPEKEIPLPAYQHSLPPLYIEGDPKSPEQWLTPVAGSPLTFAVSGQPRIKRFVPFYDIVYQRYGLYFPVVEKDSAREAEMRRAEEQWTREIDRVFVFPMEYPNNSEHAHQLKSKDASPGVVGGTAWIYRQAAPGGRFEWTLQVVPDAPVSLLCTYSGADVDRTFDIMVDGKLLRTEQLNGASPGKLVDVEYPIPEEWTKGKKEVTVAFEANHDTVAGAVFGCATYSR